MLYPINNVSREAVSLNGMWKFQLDPAGEGRSGWQNGLPKPDLIPVPASFEDFYTDKETREYCGDFWYETDFFLPAAWSGKEVGIRFGSAAHKAEVYLNGKIITSHQGGFLPFIADITEEAHFGAENRLSVCLNNELSEEQIPCGNTEILPNGKKLARPNFDFFNYSGLQRNIFLMAVPKEHLTDYELVYAIDGDDARIDYKMITNGDHPAEVELYDEEGRLAARSEGTEGCLEVRQAHLWQVRNAYLYTLVFRIFDGDRVVDEYSAKAGIRTVEIRGTSICLNGSPVYLKGFGKHEDSDIVGRGFNIGVMKRDFELMKWIGANSFRTSHYPYADEVYQMADREGILILDEVPAVGCFPNTMFSGGNRNPIPFFARKTVGNLLKNHLAAVEEMIARDKNHPCVFAWSLFNEPDTADLSARPYFKEVFERAAALDPQKRPRTFALVQNSTPDICKCHQFADFISLNRYYGWYVMGGSELPLAEAAFRKEMDAWMKVEPDKPFIFTEYGGDTLSMVDKLPSVMWSESYQNELIEMNSRVFDSYPAVVGEQIWNFADFQTGEGIIRMDGNKKGVFTRQRQPKRLAFELKKRWESLPLNYKGEQRRP